MGYNLNGINYNEAIDSQVHLLNSWADIINRAYLGMELMDERKHIITL